MTGKPSYQELEKKVEELNRELISLHQTRLTLEKSEKCFKDLVDTIPYGIQEIDEKGIIIFANPAHHQIHGYNPGELKGKSILDLCPTEKDKQELKNYLQFLVDEKPPPTPWVDKDRIQNGQLRDVRVDWSYKFDNEGKVIGFISVITDITEKKQDENKLTDTKELLEELLASSSVVTYRCKPEGDFPATFVSENVRKQLGYEPDEFIKNPHFWAGNIHPEDAPRILEELSSLFVNGHHTHEYRFLHKDGTYHWMLDKSRLRYDAEGKPLDITGNWIDITELKQAEEALRESEEKYRVLLENLPQKIFHKDKSNIYVSCNKNYARDLYIEPDNIRGTTDYDYYPKELAEKYRSDDNRIMELGESENINEKYIAAGKEYWVHTVKTPVKDENGQITGVLGIFWDITDQKQKDKELKESEEKFRAIAEMNIDYIYQIDLQGIITYCSQAVEQILGYKPEEIIGRPLADFLDPKELTRIMPYFQEVTSGKKIEHLGMKVLDKNGSEVLIETSALPIVRGEEIVGIQGISRDITEKELTRKALVKERWQLEETNIALKVLLRESSITKEELEKNMLANIKNHLLPYVVELESRLSAEEKLYTDIIKSNINEITSSFSRKLISIYCELTPREIQVADFIRQGRTNKEIARLLNITPSAVDFHRRNLRTKFNIKGKKTNLRSHLLSLAG